MCYSQNITPKHKFNRVPENPHIAFFTGQFLGFHQAQFEGADLAVYQ
jgi:hypothetical protein